MSKKPPKKSTAKRRAASSPESLAALKKTIAAQEKTIAVQEQELRQATDQQDATSDVLGVISRAPTDLQAVFDTIAEHSVKLCVALFSSVYRFDGELIHMVGHHNYSPAAVERSRQLFPSRPGRHLFTARAILDRSVIHVPDVSKDPEHPEIMETLRFRSVLSVPMLLGDDPIGAITVWHANVGPFSPKHVALLQTFAEQAVIAIENARLFQELTQKTTELEGSNAQLREALEQQTATSEILGAIAGSPTDFQPVLEAIAESATRLCDATDAHISHVDGEILRLNAHSSDPSLQREVPITRNSIAGQAIIDRRTIHIHDLAAEPEDKYGAPRWRSLGFRTVLIAPLLREATAIGTITIRRKEVRPFTEKQVMLLETFANQAVIAIENVRLFK
jgi:two-component system NtrC family sensor kinase